MESKSIFLNPNIDFQMLNQSNNFEDACSSDDFQGLMSQQQNHHHPTGKPMSKVASWHSFSENYTSSSVTGTPSGTPQNSPPNSRKLFDNRFESKASGTWSMDGGSGSNINNKPKRWFNAHLFAPFSEMGPLKDVKRAEEGTMRKAGSYKNVSNFDINAVTPISF